MNGEFTDEVDGFVVNRALLRELEKWSGTTVTIYTTSGGASGCGFTGVLTVVNCFLIRLITCIGPGPCCCLGSSCRTPGCPTHFGGRRLNRGFEQDLGCITNVGSTVDIPIENIVAFVHNSI
jgi:hypothetical protein